MAAVTKRSYAGAAPACTLTNSITAGDTTALLTGTVTAWNDTAGGPFFMVIDPGLVTEEKVLVGARSGSSLSSMTRGTDGTTAASHSAGATCYPVFTATDAGEANTLVSTMTTRGDLLTMGVGPTVARIAIGTNGQVLKSDGTDASFGTVAAAGLATDAVTTVKIQDLAVTGVKQANFAVSTKTASYTLVAADRNTRIAMNSASATTITVNDSLFSAGDTLELLNISTGVCTVTAGTATVSSAGSLAIPANGGGTLFFTSAGVSIFFPSAVTAAAGGLVRVGGGTLSGSSVAFTNVFSATYDNYIISVSNLTAASNSFLTLQLGATTSLYYNSLNFAIYTNEANFIRAGYTNSNGGTAQIFIGNPFLSLRTTFQAFISSMVTNGEASSIIGFQNSNTSFTGFTLAGTTFTGGTVNIYGLSLS